MTHPDGDTLLKFVLQTLDEPDTSVVREHLSACEQCREQERKLQGEVKRLASVDFPIDLVAPPRLPRKSQLLIAVSRSAAVLAAGFLLGFAAAELSNPVHPIAVQQRLIPAQVALPSSGYVSCQEVDVKIPRPR
jgi:anti-sigma factor RsiW